MNILSPLYCLRIRDLSGSYLHHLAVFASLTDLNPAFEPGVDHIHLLIALLSHLL